MSCIVLVLIGLETLSSSAPVIEAEAAPDVSARAWTATTAGGVGTGLGGACCLDDGSCVENVTNKGCYSQGGVFQGVGVLCVDAVCVQLPCPPGAIEEREPTCELVGDGFNSGCNTGSLAFSIADCDQVICGQAWADSGVRDTDWYLVGPMTTQTYDVQIQAEFPVSLLLIELSTGFDPCASIRVLQTRAAAPGEIVGFRECLDRNRVYVFFVAPGTPPSGAPLGEGVACADYLLSIDCSPCVTGACCLVDGQCAASIAQIECENANGIYLGDSADCAGVVCTGACCFPDATCMVTSRLDCGSQSGTFFGAATVCAEVQCDPCRTEDETDCGFPTDATNGGCGTTPRRFTSLQCDDAICASLFGETGPSGGQQDSDWYRFELTETTLVSATLEFAEFVPSMIVFAPGDGIDPCNGLMPLASNIPGPPGAPTCISTTLDAGTYYLFVSLQSTLTQRVPCPSSYRLTFRCGVPCAACDAPPACTIGCDPLARPENEPLDACDFVDDTNNGCDSAPARFSPLACEEIVCGTVARLDEQRDNDWYRYTHETDGDLAFGLTAEFRATVFIGRLGPIGDACGDGFEILQFDVAPPACEMQQYTLEDAPAGDYFVFVAPDFTTNAELCCDAVNPAKYELRVLTSCPSSDVCADANCDGAVTVGDINFFVAAVIGGESAWRQRFAPEAPECGFLSNDTNGDQLVTVGDINAFVAAVSSGQPCQR